MLYVEFIRFFRPGVIIILAVIEESGLQRLPAVISLVNFTRYIYGIPHDADSNVMQ